ncbi:DUF58 domain-containing protein [Maribacter sp. 2307ULW6-5]|uniref:DUF58 domain-containing protein n=1 Tax=Maribacter sp. 2307ULW6-5 TaxID=3386275 RepID=UPI0039BD383B
MQFIRSLYLHPVFFWYVTGLSLLFLGSHVFVPLYDVAWMATLALLALFAFDMYLLYRADGVVAKRRLPKKMSNGDANPVSIQVQNKYGFVAHLQLIDELPVQFQKRDFGHEVHLRTGEHHEFHYQLRPVDRGEYHFGQLIVYASSPLKLIKRRYGFQKNESVPVYPSIIQMQQYDFLAIHNRLSAIGLKKIRRIGHTQEFEQIKEYVTGDDIRTLNWKATAKQNQLMVNQYQDERSQPVYSIIDMGRTMKMPFNGLTLLDYAINSTLAFSNVALKRKDKTGMIAFSKDISTHIPAKSKITHLNAIMEQLYKVDTEFSDTDFGRLYGHLKRKVTHRGLLLLYTNFEHMSALKRQLPYLLGLSKQHVLVVIFFENAELEDIVKGKANNLQDVYHKTIAEKFSLEKKLMQRELQKYGIQSILTSPEKLTINTINKYLEIKARGLL